MTAFTKNVNFKAIFTRGQTRYLEMMSAYRYSICDDAYTCHFSDVNVIIFRFNAIVPLALEVLWIKRIYATTSFCQDVISSFPLGNNVNYLRCGSVVPGGCCSFSLLSGFKPPTVTGGRYSPSLCWAC